MDHNDTIFESLVECGAPLHVTGSYLITPDKANDIDVVMLNIPNLDLILKALKFKRTNLEGYKSKAKTLRSTWRKEQYNVLVVKDITAYMLWQAFSNVIANKDYAFVEKADRVKLADLIMKDYKEN